MIATMYPVGRAIFMNALVSTFEYPIPQATHDCVISRCCIVRVMHENRGYKNATGKFAEDPRKMESIAAPQPTKLIGPLKYPRNDNRPKARQSTNGLVGIKRPINDWK